jgi:hypothetical protein
MPGPDSQSSKFEALDSLPECPVCHQGDRVEKASSIVRRNTGQVFVGESLISYRFSSAIATEFAAPPPPHAPAWPSTLVKVLTSIVIATLIGAGYYAAIEYGEVDLPLAAKIAIGAFVLWFGLLSPIKTIAETVYRRQTGQRALPAWHEAMSRWERLYYCVRDDVGFVKGGVDWRTPERLNELLFAVPTMATEAPVISPNTDLAVPSV